MLSVWRSSIGCICALACMSCSCWLMTACSVTLAGASTLMRRLLRQPQAVCNALRSCALMMPIRSPDWCKEAQVASSVSWVCVNLQA